jgi:hypothetical protein
MSGMWVRCIRVNVFVAYGWRRDDFFILGGRRLLPVIGPRRVVALRDTLLRLIIRASK